MKPLAVATPSRCLQTKEKIKCIYCESKWKCDFNQSCIVILGLTVKPVLTFQSLFVFIDIVILLASIQYVILSIFSRYFPCWAFGRSFWTCVLLPPRLFLLAYLRWRLFGLSRFCSWVILCQILVKCFSWFLSYPWNLPETKFLFLWFDIIISLKIFLVFFLSR